MGRTHLTDVYDEAMRTHEQVGDLEVTNLDSPFGEVIASGQAKISNNSTGAPRSGGLPLALPPLRHFLGVPITTRGAVVGLIGVANRSGGYGGDEQTRIEIFSRATSVLYDNYCGRERELALEEELQRRRDELAHVSRVATMGGLGASIAHELNQPLTAILNCAGTTMRLLAAEEPDLEELDEAQQTIVESATRAGEIIRHQHDFLRRGELTKTPVAINELIRNITRVTRAEVLRNKIALLQDLAPDLPRIMGDPIQLEQVILNLIRNGVEAMADPAWGNRELLVQTAMSGPHWIVLKVRDTGPPIDDEAFAQMFTPFHTTKPEGLGMGLSISRTIVEAHGGRLRATRNPELGITIDLTLACEEESS